MMDRLKFCAMAEQLDSIHFVCDAEHRSQKLFWIALYVKS